MWRQIMRHWVEDECSSRFPLCGDHKEMNDPRQLSNKAHFEPIWYPIAGHLWLHSRHLSTPVCWKLIYRIKLLLDGRSDPKRRLPNGHSILLTSSKIISNGWLTIRNVSKGCFLLSITISIGRVSLGSMVANNLSLNEFLPLNVVMWKISLRWRKHFFYEKNF